MSFAGNNDTGNYLTGPSGLLVGASPGSGDWTIHTWYKPSSTTGFQNIWFLTNAYALQVNNTGGLEFYYGGTNALVIVSSITVGTWYSVTVAKTGTTLARCYLDGKQVGSDITANLSATNTGTQGFGAWDPGGSTADYVRGSIGPTKIWDTRLSSVELLPEGNIVYPRRTKNLRAFYPFFGGGSTERVKNYLSLLSTPQGDCTQTGTALTDDAGPPVIWRPAPILVPWSSPAPVLSASQVSNTIELTWS